ncbi:MAG: ureidoglycolate lyase [Ferrovibrio sp.]|uniref:ureidoglycolate lyase n=1 Tax=Ferrovibrio sp. TaxID=1917215 RepID=UPI0026350EE3|nr:ureidoglycolate lyase [Ferrovibrio sp.]MCW0234022.1 ureidoglycolate lyase [Ferrovibrio sp.]
MLQLAARPLTAEAFAPYGEVLAAPADTGRHYYGPLIENRRPQAGLDFSLSTVAASHLPLKLKLFERHAFSAQVFMPVDVARYLVTVCPDNGQGRPDAGRAISFVAPSNVGVMYAAGTWHHPMVALDRPGRFSIVMWACGDAGDEELIPLDREIEVHPA